MKKVNYYIYIFLVASIVGWMGEVVWRSIYFGHFVNPGTLTGPFCPVYGTTAIFIFMLLKEKRNIIVNFFICAFSCVSIEYLAAYISEEFFNHRLWNYSKKAFNFQGRICLSMSLMFITISMIAFYIIKPILDKIFEKKYNIVKIFNLIVGFLFICNIILEIIF